MVNVNKPISKDDGKVQKVENRRPRNTELNSSKKITKSLAAMRKLNCSREAALEELKQWFSDDEAKEYIDSFEEQTGAKVTRLATAEEAEQYDGDFWATKDGEEALWCRGNGMWYKKDDLDSSCGDKADVNSSAELDSAEQQTSGNGWWEDDGSYFAKLDKDAIGDAMVNAVKYIDSKTDWDHMQGKVDMKDDEEYAFRYDRASVFVEDDSLPGTEVAPRNDDSIEKLQKGDFDNALCYVSVGENYCYALGKDVVGAIHQLATDPASIWYKLYPDNLKSKNAPETDTEAEVDSSKKLNCAEDGEPKIMTESGNEISLSDIQIVQNPETNEISLFIKEDEDEEIPEGFVVIATATQPALPVEETEVEEVAEGDEELDSSKKKNSMMN